MKSITRIRLLITALLAAFFLMGCSAFPSQQSGLNTATDVASLIVLEDAYQDAKQTLTNRLDSMPDETGVALLNLEVKTDALVADFKAAWGAPTSIAQIDSLMARTALLYEEGKALVTPLLPDMTEAERTQLQRLDVTWNRVYAAYQRWQSDPQSQELRAMLSAGMELATALLLIAGK